jgi:hypothetical protein
MDYCANGSLDERRIGRFGIKSSAQSARFLIASNFENLPIPFIGKNGMTLATALPPSCPAGLTLTSKAHSRIV